jgi:hypothetical protein
MCRVLELCGKKIQYNNINPGEGDNNTVLFSWTVSGKYLMSFRKEKKNYKVFIKKKKK